MKKTVKYIMVLSIATAISFSAQAQPGSGGAGFDDEPQDVPVDGGIVLLAAAGVAYGFKKLKK